MPRKPVATYTVKVYAGELNDAGYDKLADALNGADLADGIYEFVYDALKEHLPYSCDERRGELEWFTLEVEET